MKGRHGGRRGGNGQASDETLQFGGIPRLSDAAVCCFNHSQDEAD